MEIDSDDIFIQNMVFVTFNNLGDHSNKTSVLTFQLQKYGHLPFDGLKWFFETKNKMGITFWNKITLLAPIGTYLNYLV